VDTFAFTLPSWAFKARIQWTRKSVPEHRSFLERVERETLPLVIRLFGPFELLVNGCPPPRLRTRKGQWLLALLAMRAGRELDRAWLASTLWPDSSATQAFVNLRVSLNDLRRVLGVAGAQSVERARLCSPTGRTLCLDLTGAEVDVVAFDEGIACGNINALERAVAFYRGPLLEECTEEWVFQERQGHEQAYLQALERLAAHALKRGEPVAAERYLRRAVEVDPLRESAQRALMQALASGGNYGAANQVYRELRLLLHQELNGEPDPETAALYERIRAEVREKAAAGARLPARGENASPGSLSRERGAESGELAEGTVTFLLTDIEGSTKLWLQHPDAMRVALARHDQLLTAEIEYYGGTILKQRGEGDSCFAVFSRATSAVAATASLQRALVLEPWPAEVRLHVRVALHTGEAELREGDYYGPAVNHCARLRAVAHGGQTLLSQTTAALVRDDLPEGVSLRELGAHRLKDLQRPEPIFQLLHPNLPAEFPPLRSLEAFAHNLPLQLTRFIGREREMAAVKRLLQSARLLTLTGAGGCGKTRLALQVAADLLPEYPDGVWLVELAALADPALVPQTVAAVLGVQEESDRPLLVTLGDYLRTRTLLLVLDNCEHLLAACTQLTEGVLRGCPNLRVLATSREGLGIAGEQIYRVPSLPVPDPKQLPSLERLQEFEAVSLFTDRAILSQPDFAVTEVNALAVAQVCHRLDGIPLAIELAASRVKALPVEAIAERLADRFRLLTGGSRTAPSRQQTLRALIDWSYNLLSEAERRLLRRLSVFSGGWTLEAADAVCAGDGIEVWEVLDLLSRLVEKSLVVYEDKEGEARYHLLETVRQYSRDRILEAGEAEGVRHGHRDYFLELAERAEPAIGGADQVEWLKRLDAEQDNLRAALERCREASDVEVGLRLAVALGPFWLKRGAFGEGRQWLEGSLLEGSRSGESNASASTRAKALLWVGRHAHHQGDLTSSRSFLEEGLALAREVGETWVAVVALVHLGFVVASQGDYGRAAVFANEALAIAQQIGDKRLLACSLDSLGVVARLQKEYERAVAFHAECLALARDLGDKWWVAVTLGSLAVEMRGLGDYEQARAFHSEQLALALELDEKREIASCLDGLAGLALGQGQAERAARLMAVAEALRQAIGTSLPPSRRTVLDSTLEAARATLDATVFSAAWAEGRAMTIEEALDEALKPLAPLNLGDDSSGSVARR
jgi:predicted ATPase/class 3 adenylate cyclase